MPRLRRWWVAGSFWGKRALRSRWPGPELKRWLPHKFRSDTASKPGPFENRRVHHPQKTDAFVWVEWKGAPPSMTLSALSRDTSSLRAASSSFLLVLTRAFAVSFISTKARCLNPAVESGSTSHLFGHRSSDHDSFFRRRDRSREQGAQSA